MLAWKWGVTFWEAIAEAPGRIFDTLFVNPVTGLPLFFTLILTAMYGIFSLLIFFGIFMIGGIETYKAGEIKTRFRDVWGQDPVLGKVQENIDFLEKPAEIEAKGGYVPSGILLWGPPGTGKTLMAEAVAGETGKPYVFVDPSAFVQTFIGVAPMKIKWLYRKLRKLALRYGGVVVFFDEADVLGNRGSAGSGGQFDARKNHRGDGRASRLQRRPLRGRPRPVHRVARPAARRGSSRASTGRTRSPRSGASSWAAWAWAGGMGALQALLTEMSGLKKPRGFFSRRLRSFLCMKPKPPPKYRILHIMATNRPDVLDDALLRPGRLDRIYKVGYPHVDGRRRTYEGYLDKVKHELTAPQVDRLAVISPYATGAMIKDIVNEALIIAMRDGRDTITWADMLKAKHLKTHGIPDDWTYGDLERHQVAIHEACHAVAMYRLQKRSTIDVATIERRGGTGGFVAPMPLEERFTEWRTGFEINVKTFLASLAGERMLFEGDNSAGVGGDLYNATRIVMETQAYWGMGPTIASPRRDEGATRRGQLPPRGRHRPQPVRDGVRPPDRGTPAGAAGRDGGPPAGQPALRAGHRPRAGDLRDGHRRRHRRHLPGHAGADAGRLGVPHGRLPAVLRGVPPEHDRGPPGPGQAQPGAPGHRVACRGTNGWAPPSPGVPRRPAR